MNKMQLLMALLLLPVCSGRAVGLQSVCKSAVCKTNDGSLDTTFANHGKEITVVSDIGSQANGVVVLPCGRIVAVGNTSGDEGNSFVLVGYTPYGALDTNFGNNGIVFTNFSTVLGVGPLSTDHAYAVALQTNCNGCDDTCGDCCDSSCNNNCKIVVVGSTTAFSSRIHFAVARYNCDGSLDATFGAQGTGVVVIPLSALSRDEAYAVAIQADNKIVIAGYTMDNTARTVFAVMRLNCDGTLDTTFGCNRTGIVTIGFNGSVTDIAQAVKIQKDGKIVVAGLSAQASSVDFALARLTTDGMLDKSFNGNGKVLTDFSGANATQDIAYALVLIEDCRERCCSDDTRATIVAVGDSSGLLGTSFALAGYKENGQLDNQFGQDHNGKVLTRFVSDNFSIAYAAVLQKDCAQKCKIVAVGASGDAGVGFFVSDFALARYDIDGCLDDSFGIGGKITTDFSQERDDQAKAVALQQNGDIVVAGSSNALSGGNIALARYKVCNPCCALCGLACTTCK